MNKILTFGEIMLRVSPLNVDERIVQANNFRIEPGGSESNVAIALANLGESVAFLTKLPDNKLSEIIYQYLRKYNVDTSYIVTGGGRLGAYYTEHGVGPRPSIVVYDRENSAFSLTEFKDFDMNKMNKNFSWFHTSGVSPAVSRNASKTLGKIIAQLKNNIRISIDLNYRKKLWGWVDAPRSGYIKKIMLKLCSKAYLLTANETDFQDVFGFDAEEEAPDKKYSMIVRTAFDKMPKLQFIGISLRESISASENVWRGMLFLRDGKSFKSQVFRINNIVDRVGAGDSFTAGIVHGIINKTSPQHTIDFAVALSALKHTTRGDASQFKRSDVEHLLKVGSGGRIVR